MSMMKLNRGNKKNLTSKGAFVSNGLAGNLTYALLNFALYSYYFNIFGIAHQTEIPLYSIVLLYLTTISAGLYFLIEIALNGILHNINRQERRVRLFVFLTLVFIVQLILMIVVLFAALANELTIISNVSEISSSLNRIDYLYFSIVTFTTLGYGDLSPSPELRIWASLHALVGYFILALFIGILLKISSTQKNRVRITKNNS